MREMVDLEENPDSEDRFFVENYSSNNGFYTSTCICVLLLEPSLNSAYRDAVITVQLDLPPEYPFKPPDIQFLTPIFHQNIHDGHLCSHIFRLDWEYQKGIRWCLGQLHTMLVDEGRNFDDMEICKDTNIVFARDNYYLMYDKLIQRCFGHELPSDEVMYDRRDEGDCFENWYETHSFETEMSLQKKLEIHQLALFQEISGELNDMTATTLKNFLSISAPENGLDFVQTTKSEDLYSEYKLEAVEKIDEEKCDSVSVTMPDGDEEKQLSIPKYPCLQILQDLDAKGDIRIPISFTCVSKLLPLCNISRKAMEIRRVNPTLTEMLEDLPDNKEDLLDIIKAADFLCAEYITLNCCLKLNFMIKKESRDMVAAAEALEQQKKPKAQFKIFYRKK